MRARVISLLMVPVVSLLALWGHATVTTAQDVSRLRQLQRVDAEIRTPLTTAVAALQAERAAAVRQASAPSATRATELDRLARTTERTVRALRLGSGHTVADGQDLPDAVGRRLEEFVSGTERLGALRAGLADGEVDWRGAYEHYTRSIATAFTVGGALSGIQDSGPGSDARVRLEFSLAGEALAREAVLMDGARPAGELSGERLRLFTGAVHTRRTLVESAAPDLRGPARTAWRELADDDAYTALVALEDGALRAAPGSAALAAAPQEAWTSAHARVLSGVRAIERAPARDVAGRAGPFARGLLTPAGAAVLLGLAAVAASLVISVRIGRGLVLDLVGLRDGALEVARRRLPDAMRRLRAGEEIDIRAEAPAGPRAEDETGQVAEALGTVHRAALHAAVERAELAGGVAGVFVNLARRSQVLVHRQLSLLDAMERRAEDPNELSDLFRLDHLTTRTRRHAENLIILSGSAPGRAWRAPVPLTDVIRAAVSEIEDYARVEVRRLPEVLLAGAAVADLTHLLAEIVENAAQFSPPHTRVRITGEPVGNGYAVEVEDRGLGMGRETLAEANRRIARPEDLDLFDSDRLGLFVVSRLAARQGVKVHLRPSPYGGTTAVVLLPVALLQNGAAERSAGEVTGLARPAGAGYARVPAACPPERAAPGTRDLPAPLAPGTPVPVGTAPSERPRPEAAPPDTTPPGVTALHPHRIPDEPEPAAGLPRRVRQASLAPQLRAAPRDEAAPASGPDADDHRTPELVRARMAAYRAGWVRGGGGQPGRATAPADRPAGGRREGDPT